MQLLKDSETPLSAEDIMRVLNERIDLEVIYSDLQHIARSVRGASKGRECLAMFPPTCRACGFTFGKLKKPKKPSRCPKCRSERLAPPKFTIIAK